MIRFAVTVGLLAWMTGTAFAREAGAADYTGGGITIAASERDLRVHGMRVVSARPLSLVQAQWIDVVRLNVLDPAERDTVRITSGGL